VTLAARLRAQLAASSDRPVPRRGDADDLATPSPRRAAVIVAITDRPEPGLILTQRPDTMPSHPGQVAFPGGRVEADDADDIAAALREAEEEIALARDAVDVLGAIASYHTISGFEVVPVVGVIAPDLTLIPHEREVAGIFEMPLHVAIDRARYTARTVVVDGRSRDYLEQHWGDRRIWGATAAMLVNLGARLA